MSNRTDAQAAIDALSAKQGVVDSITPTNLSSDQLQVMLNNSRMLDEPLSVSEETVGDFTTIADQIPTGDGDAGKIIVNYGVGGTTANGDFTLNGDGTVLANNTVSQHSFRLALRFSRTGASGTSIIVGRLMLAPDGVIANGFQVDDSFTLKISNTNESWREVFLGNFTPPQGSLLWFEIARDEAGSNSGQLSAVQPSGTLSGWNQSNTATLTISKRVASL